MNANKFGFKSIARGVITLASLSASFAFAADVTADATTPNATLVVAQAMPTSSARPVVADAFPAYQAGVRAAAAESPEALRRYTWRTRMIYNFRYADFAPKE
jgi:hypothetical protein